MDPLTHTLVGANLAGTRLGGRTRLAGAALVLGANLPDVDSILYFTGHEDLALGFRRGWTHGVLALLVLPFVQTALLLLYDRLRPHAHRRANPRWLLLLSALATLTHPALDWLNNYGLRWLMPFDGTWFYGDSVYIMDPWLWLILGVGWLANQRPTFSLITAWVVVSALLLYIVYGRSPRYVLIVTVVAAILFAAMWWRAPRPLAGGALILGIVYVGARIGTHAATEQRVRAEIGAPVTKLMVAPLPIDPFRWDVVAQTGDVYRFGRYSWLDRSLTLDPQRLPVAKDSPEWRAAQRDPSVQGFLSWMRFPWYEVERDARGTRVLIHDARYAVRRRAGGGFGGVVVTLP
ncbi:MAG TPA: metal-dependent hydrolase [Thermoanaerobaculia bacterium]|nr:metal-dependent hydrolase [Thermoanaerobaculia bacterium]